MKAFALNFCLFIVGGLGLLATTYVLADWYYNHDAVSSSEGRIYIWGDSQALYGLDLQLLSENAGKNTFSAARPGAGVYDLWVFCESVPNGALVVVELSKPAQIRPKDTDNNRTGLSINGLAKLSVAGYSIVELYGIAKNNLFARRIFNSNNEEYLKVQSNTDANMEPISMFKQLYGEMPDYLGMKQQVYFDALLTLKQKQCRIILLEFPYSQTLQKIEEASVIHDTEMSFIARCQSALDIHDSDTLIIGSAKSLMRDHTHFNSNGAQKATEHLARYLIGKNTNSMITFMVKDDKM